MEISGKSETADNKPALRALPLRVWSALACRRHIGRIVISLGRRIVTRRLAGEFLPALFFLLGFLCQIALAFFELVIWFGQESTFDEKREKGSPKSRQSLQC
jgi:hypothetical protein